jgi:DNA-binding protein YbaB
MAREIDEAFIDEAIDRYQRVEAQLAEFNQACAAMEVTVRSPDGLVEVVVTLAGTIRDVVIDERLLGESGRTVSTSVRLAVTAAADAANWARQKLHADSFADYHAVGRA